jgi:predicted ArsR family transcriptional regulator
VSGLQQQARALGDPTRHELYRYVVAAPGPVGVAELTAHLGVHHNAVRQHLAKLVDAGLLVETTRPAAGRGRPSLQYEPDRAVAARWGAVGPYERLAVWLTEVIATGATAVDVGHRAGASDPFLETSDDRDESLDDHDRSLGPARSLARQMDRHGFAPTLTQEADRVEMVLHQCPFASAALADQDVVCSLHLGMAHGFAEAIGGIEIDELAPTDPRHPHCRLVAHVPGHVPDPGGAAR